MNHRSTAAACLALCLALVPMAYASADETVAAYLPFNAPAAEVSTGMDGEKESLASRILSRTSLNWTGQLNGPTLGEGYDGNYNTYQNSHGPLYVYHTLDLLHFFGESSHVGLELSAKQDFGHAIKVEGKYGPYEIHPSSAIYDPQIWYRSNGVYENSWLGFDAAFNVWPGLTEYSRQQEYLTFAAALDGNVRFKLPDFRWRAFISSRIKPSFYSSGAQNSEWPHEQVFFSTSPALGYRISNAFDLVSTTQFDFRYYKDGSGSFIRENAYDDKTQLQLNYYHSSGLARVGAYVQSLIVDPKLSTATVGMDLTIHFLRAK